MKQGTVTKGNATTHYGDAAQVFMARKWIENCYDNKKAAQYINKQKPGLYRDELISEALKMGMVRECKNGNVCAKAEI